MPLQKTCPVCSSSFYGRLNQIYCSISCKSIFNNQKAKEKHVFSSEINQCLKANRFILERLYSQYKDELIPKDTMVSHGYQFEYFTHLAKDKDGKVGKGCFDFCLLQYDNNFKIVSGNE